MPRAALFRTVLQGTVLQTLIELRSSRDPRDSRSVA